MNFFSLFKRKILYKIKKKINIDLDQVHKKTLDDLFYHYGSDKADTFKHNQEQGHGFSKFYEQQLKKILKKIKYETNSNFFDIIIDDGSHYLSDILFSFKTLFKYVKKGGFYIIEDFKHPNYYGYNRNIEHILVDQVLVNLQEKKIFNSDIIKNDDQVYLHNNINEIKIYKGNLKDSDICFLQKS